MSFTGHKHTDEFKKKLSKMRLAGLIGRPLKSQTERTYKIRENNRQWKRRYNSTLKGKLINRMKVSLRSALNGKSYWKLLPYSKDEFIAHIKSELKKYKNKCPLCSNDISEVFNIDHRIPLSTLDNDANENEILALFELSNLSVLCPFCNQYVKKNKNVDY